VDENEIGRFFDALTSDYTAAIERCFPRYREMLWALLDCLPQGRRFGSVLELGCGTGNLSILLRTAFPEAALRLVDMSGESLEACRGRLGAVAGLAFEQRDFGEADYATGSFDLVVSSIAIHHLDSPGKQQLFRRVKTWLADDGVLCFADQCAGATADLNARHIENWKALSLRAGAPGSEWEMWMRHQVEHDHHDTLVDQLDWLREAGFATVDCTWRYLLWSVIQARRGNPGSCA